MNPLNLLSMVNKSRRRSALFVLCLQARPFSGLFGKVDPTPIKLTRLLARMASALLVPFRFRNCIPNTLGICLSWLISRVRPGQSWGVRSWGSFGVFCSRELLSFHHPNSSEVSALFASIFVVFWSSGDFLSVYCLSLCSLFIADIL